MATASKYTITENELLRLTPETETRLATFIKSRRLNYRELASLSSAILRDIGREKHNMIQGIIMMEALKDLRGAELRGELNEEHSPKGAQQ